MIDATDTLMQENRSLLIARACADQSLPGRPTSTEVHHAAGRPVEMIPVVGRSLTCNPISSILFESLAGLSGLVLHNDNRSDRAMAIFLKRSRRPS